MPGEVLSLRIGFARWALVAGAAALLAGPAAAVAAGNTARVSLEVPVGKFKSVRLRSLPRDTVLTVSVTADAPLLVALVAAAQLKKPEPDALFQGAVDRRMSFQVAVPEAGDYYLVLDNRRGKQPVKAGATIQAQRAKGPAGEPAPPARKPGAV